MDHINGDVNQEEADVTEGFSVETEKMEMDGYSMISHNLLSVLSERISARISQNEAEEEREEM